MIKNFIEKYGSLLFSILLNKTQTWLIIVDRQFKIRWCNKAVAKVIKSKNPEELEGKNVFEVFPFLRKGEREKFFKIALVSSKEEEWEERIKIGGEEILIRISILPIKPVENEEFIVIIIRNLTQLHHLSSKFTETTFYLEMLLENIRVYAIIITDKNHKIKKFNKGAEILFEYTPEEIYSRNIIELFPEESQEKYREEILKSLKVIPLIRREIKMRRKNGERFIADLTVSKMLGKTGGLIGYLYMASDITEHKKLQENIEKQNKELVRLYAETQQASKAKSIFLANMSHELRTPLTAILGFAELLMDEKVGSLNETQKEFLKDIYTSGKHLLQLINDILDLSKIEAEKMELHIEPVNIKDVANAAKTFIRVQAQKKGISLIDEYPVEEVIVRGDESRLKQIMYNLYSNAVKFTPEGGKITTVINRNNDYAEVSVIDTGIGIKPEDQKVIFEEFVQIENPYTKKYTGTGLGLALVKKFVEMMGGKISVYSEGEGKGTKFTFTIPIWKEPKLEMTKGEERV